MDRITKANLDQNVKECGPLHTIDLGNPSIFTGEFLNWATLLTPVILKELHPIHVTM